MAMDGCRRDSAALQCKVKPSPVEDAFNNGKGEAMSLKLLLPLLLIAGAAAAETITLDTETCTATNICFQVPNDQSESVEFISNAVQYRRLVISINGDIFDTGLWALASPPATPVGSTTTYTQSATLYDPNGNAVAGSLNWRIVVGAKCLQSGRVCVFPRTVTLLGGTLAR
jgi:hypothetical protein